MKVILKYPLCQPFEIPAITSISMQKDFEIISIGTQSNIPTVWGIGDTEQDANELRHFALVPTGSTGFDRIIVKQFYGTVLLHSDQLVLHIFETEKPSL